MYDVVIPCAKKDYCKIKYCVDSLKFLNPAPTTVFIVSPTKINIPNTTWIDEKNAINISVEDINYRRPNWIYQQILKLCQNFTLDNYLCIDSDLVFKRKIDLFHEETGNPYFLISNHKQNHQPYFDFMKKVFGLEKYVDYSFISDITMFNRFYLKEFIKDESWLLEMCNMHLSEDCLIGEPEIYGNYLAKYYPFSFHTKDIKVSMYGKYMPELYSDPEINAIINYEKKIDSDIISMHSWT